MDLAGPRASPGDWPPELARTIPRGERERAKGIEPS
jgi:hypothetical protein